MNAFITAQGFAKTGMFTVMIGAVANIILDPVFIYGFHMGVRGAALATILSQGISCVWVIHFLCGEKTILRLKRKKSSSGFWFGASVPCIGTFCVYHAASESVISVCFNSSLLAYGGDLAVGAMTILTSVMQFAMLPRKGLGQGAQPITSYNYGAKNRERVKKSFRLLLTISLVYSVVLWAFILIIPRLFVGMFTSDATLLDFTSRHYVYIVVHCLFSVSRLPAR